MFGWVFVLNAQRSCLARPGKYVIREVQIIEIASFIGLQFSRDCQNTHAQTHNYRQQLCLNSQGGFSSG
jgi:hypothetical protein